MKQSIARWVYDHSPIWVQDSLCTFAGWQRKRQRYDVQFDERLEFFRRASKWSLAEAEAYQLEKLRELLAYARERVPYYRQARGGPGELPASLGSLAEWSRLPRLTKDDVRRAASTLVSDEYRPETLHLSHSGGSTGMPLRCYHDTDSLRNVYASHWAEQRPGVGRDDRYATFQGLEIIPRGQRGGPYWRQNRAMNQRLYSIFYLSEGTIADYVRDLDAYQPVYFAGYANSLYLLARLAEEQGIRPAHHPRAVFTTSEQLYPSYRETIERVFGTKVWDAYSQDETCGSITEHACGYYHYDRAYGFMEFVDTGEHVEGRRVAEIICTGFLNRPWPLLRYAPGDLVEYTPAERCPGCGRAGPLIHGIRGRTGDVLLTPSGRRFPHISLVVKSLHGVRQLQLVQNAVDDVLIRFVPSEDFAGQADVDLMVESFREAVAEPIRWRAEQVAEIQRTAAGKFRSIINNIGKS